MSMFGNLRVCSISCGQNLNLASIYSFPWKFNRDSTCYCFTESCHLEWRKLNDRFVVCCVWILNFIYSFLFGWLWTNKSLQDLSTGAAPVQEWLLMNWLIDSKCDCCFAVRFRCGPEAAQERSRQLSMQPTTTTDLATEHPRAWTWVSAHTLKPSHQWNKLLL